MKPAEHIKKAQKELADMVEHGHLKDDFELAKAVTWAQWVLQEVKRITERNAGT